MGVGLSDYKNMKIYLLILALTVLSQAKFRHLSNLTVQAITPPLIKSLTPNELAIRYQNTAIILNISNQVVLQTIALPPQSTIELLPSQSLILYINQNTVYQTHPSSAEYDLAFTAKDQDVIPPISSFGSTLAAPTYGDKSQIKLIGPNPWDSKTLTRTLLDGENIKGGSEVNFVGEKQFYFSAGGVCNGAGGSIYLHKSDGTTINKIYDFPLRACSFDKQNREWSLSTFPFGDFNYHLLTYASQSSQRSHYTSQLISIKKGKITEQLHFEIDRVIGATFGIFQNGNSFNVYTADNLFCRVQRQNIIYPRHERLPSQIKTKPKRIYVSPSQNFIISVAPYYNVENKDSAIVQSIDKDGKFSNGASYAISTATNIIRGELLEDFYVVMMDDSAEAPLSIWDIQVQPQNYRSNLKGVVDFCVSNMNVVFVLTNNAGKQTLGVYKMVEKVFTLASSTPLLNTYTSLNCLDNNNALLSPDTGSFSIFQYVDTDLTSISNMVKNATIHATFNYVKDTLIFTNAASNKTTFYDYNFAVKVLSFNLPPNSVFKILEPRGNRVIIAVGSEVDSYSSLQYYQLANSVLDYWGTFPYFNDGVAVLQKTILFASRKILHIQYQDGSTEWATYFDLLFAPIFSLGYFFDDVEKDCSQYANAIFLSTFLLRHMIVLNKNNDYPIIEKYQIDESIIGNNVRKIESYPLPQYRNSLASIRLSSSSNELIISGVNAVNRNYMIQVRNINMLSKVIYSKEEHSSLDGKIIESVDIINDLIVSLYSNEKDEDNLDIYFRANTQGQVALNNDIFSAITLIAACPNCDFFAFTGTLKVVTDTPPIIVSSYMNPQDVRTATATCLPDLLAVAPGGMQLAWKCPSKEIFVYDLPTKTATPVAITYTTITELSYMDSENLLVNIDGAFQRVRIGVPQPQTKANLNAGSLSSFAIDYIHGIYAVVVNASTIQIYDINSKEVIETFTLNNNVDISSISFSSNGDLYVSKSSGTIIILTQTPCSIDKKPVDGFCQCKQLYAQNGDQCTCDFVRQDDGSCVCDDGYYFNGNDNCNSCSAMCSTCNSDGAFDCGDYSVWFFLIIIGIILLVGGGILVAIFKLKKKKEKADTMYTQEKSKLSQPFVSEKEKSESQEVMRRSSKE